MIVRTENPEKLANKLHDFKYPCKRCGRKVFIPHHLKKLLCSYCHHYVYKDAKDEFEDRIKSEMLKRR